MCNCRHPKHAPCSTTDTRGTENYSVDLVAQANNAFAISVALTHEGRWDELAGYRAQAKKFDSKF